MLTFIKNNKPIAISLSLIFFVLWGIYGEDFWTYLSWLLILIILLVIVLLPKGDMRFKTGFKDNETLGPFAILLVLALLFTIVYYVGVLLYDWTIIQEIIN